MSEEWDGKVVSSTPWGPIVEMSLGDLLARKDAEIERQARHIEELREKIDAEKSCACSFDAPGDVCAAHSPSLTRALAEVERLRAEIERLRTVYVLIVSEEAGPVDSATCWYEDKIIGCYISREAAEGAAKLLMEDWRISEYALEGKP